MRDNQAPLTRGRAAGLTAGGYGTRRTRGFAPPADDRAGLTADHECMLAIVLLTVSPVVVAMAAATILAVTAGLTGMRIADHRRQAAAGDALTDEQVEEQVARRLGYAPRRTTA